MEELSERQVIILYLPKMDQSRVGERLEASFVVLSVLTVMTAAFIERHPQKQNPKTSPPCNLKQLCLNECGWQIQFLEIDAYL